MAKKILTIAITAGGTIENIDSVRTIKNTSTGKLASLICKQLIYHLEKNGFLYTIHYIMSQDAIKPDLNNKNIIFYKISNTKSVQDTVQTLLNTTSVDYFIHSMAISDFSPSSAVSIPDIVKELTEYTIKCNKKKPLNNIKNDIEKILRTPKNKINTTKKIHSDKDLYLLLKRTPKIISSIKKQKNPPYLVGFKLLHGVTEKQLVKAATEQALKNNCDLVLANDLKYINNGKHIGLLIKNGKIQSKLVGKEAIAKGIVKEMLKKELI